MKTADRLVFKNPIKIQIWKNDALIADIDFSNAVTNQGKNYILNAGFNSGTQISSSSWYIGLIDGAGTPSLASGDLLSSHAGWTENTSYTGNRPAWGNGTASGQAVTNSSPVSYTMTSAGSLYGIFVASVNTGGMSTDILWSEAAFPSVVPVAIADQLKVTYTVAT